MGANGISRLPYKRDRQIAKLNLAATKRSMSGRHSIFDISLLPTSYGVGNNSVNAIVAQSNLSGLTAGRPWIATPLVVLPTREQGLIYQIDFRDTNALIDSVQGLTITQYGTPEFSSEHGLETLRADQDAVDVGSTLNLHNPTGDFCYEVIGWEPLTLATTQSVFGTEHTDQRARGPFLYWASSGSFTLIIQTDITNSLNFSFMPELGRKYHVVMERAGDIVRVYVDGISLGEQTVSGATQSAQREFVVGRRNWTINTDSAWSTARFQGIRLYNRAKYNGNFEPLEDFPIFESGPGYGEIIANGVRTWFNYPVMIGTGDRVLLTSVSSDRRLSARATLNSWNPTTGEKTRVRSGGYSTMNDHNNGGILQLEDETVIWMPAGHNVAQQLMYRGPDSSSLVETDISSQLQSENYTYTNLFELTGAVDKPVYLFGRGGNPRVQLYSKSIDQGVTWGTYTPWLALPNHRPYVKYFKSSDTRIDFILTDGHPDEIINKIYHGYFENDTFFRSDGTPVTGSMPYLPSDFTQIHDGTNNGWIWDIRYFNGTVNVLYATFPSTSAHRYHAATWTDNTWVSEVLVQDAGDKLYTLEPYYSGGMCFHPTDPNIVFACVEIDNVYQLTRMQKSGADWTQTVLTSGSGRNFRPEVTTNPNTITWNYEGLTQLDGTQFGYKSYTDFNGVVICGKTI